MMALNCIESWLFILVIILGGKSNILTLWCLHSRTGVIVMNVFVAERSAGRSSSAARCSPSSVLDPTNGHINIYVRIKFFFTFSFIRFLGWGVMSTDYS